MRLCILFLCLFLLTGCQVKTATPASEPVETFLPIKETTSPPETTMVTEPPDPIREILDQMSIEERVGQIFLARCDQTTALNHIQQYHLGGFVLFGADFREETPTSVQIKLSDYQSCSKIPLLIAVDEEGGTVTRVSRYPAFRENNFSSPRDLYSWGGMDWVIAVEEEKAQLLSSLGINVNLGPVCDITTDPEAFMYKRSLGENAALTSEFVALTVKTGKTYGLGCALKHFPGYGNNTDTHTGIAHDSRTLAMLEEQDLIPFQAGIAAGAGAILVSHTITECLDPDLPASLSPAVHQYLRETMGFEGVILTDDLVMEAIAELYGAGEAAVLAVLAGNDLLCATDYITQYEAVLAAVLDERIDLAILNQAVRNILEWKQELGLI